MMNLPVRIYDKHHNTMLYPDEAHAAGVFLDTFGRPFQLKRSWFSVTIAYLTGCIVMHRTPHRSAAGEFLWEGDICDFEIPNGFGSVTPCRGLMQWDRGLQKWNVSITAPQNSGMFTDGFHVGLINLKRVGDLYTTPDIMKQTPYAEPKGTN